jgi:serine/threonine-protein kinase
MFIVMEYVEGASLSQLMRTLGRRNELVPLPVACAVVTGLLHGLHAAHEAVDEQGLPLGIVHRDVSPQNVLVGTDGIARVLDFGVAKAVGQAHVTREGEIKGKLAYMAPEQLTAGSEGLTRSADVFAAGIILWELLTGRRLFYGSNDGETVRRLLDAEIPPPSTLNDAIPPELDDVVLRALERDVTRRFATAAEMAAQLEAAIPPAGARQVGDWVRALAADALATRAELLLQAESSVTIAGVAAARTPGEPRPAPRRWVWALAALGSVALVGVGWGASSMVRPAPQVGAGLDASPPPSSAAPGPAASELALVQAPVPSAASSAPVVASSIATASASAATPILKGRPSPKPRSAPSAPIYSRD